MSKCAGIMSCKCLRASPWKKSLKSLYPPQSSGYERDLEAQNAEELAKLALRNEKLFTPISNALVKNINRDLRKEKYGYVSIGVSAFIALVDMCHDNLYRFESSVYNVLVMLLRVEDVIVRVDAMNLLIKVCQYKEQNDDSSNGKYFDFLTSILADCEKELGTLDDTLALKETCVNVLYQLILICPAALITTMLPKIIPILVNTIYLCHEDKYKEHPDIHTLRTESIRCLSTIYPLVNVITSSALLSPVFTSLDSYGWFSIAFVRSVLRSLTSTKNRDGFGKPGYLHILSHIVTLLPALSYDDCSTVKLESFVAKEEEPTSSHRSSNVVEMADFTITARKLRLVTNILLFIQSIFDETRISTFFHIQQISEVLTSLFQYTLVLAIKNNLTFPLVHVSCEVEDVQNYEDSSTNEELLQKCICQLNSVCEDTLITFGKSIVETRDYFSFLGDILSFVDDSDDMFKKPLLHLGIQIVATKQLSSSLLLPVDLIQLLGDKMIEDDPEIRLLWIQLFTELFHAIKRENSIHVITSLKDQVFNYRLLQSLFLENNSPEHYQELSNLITCILSIDVQNALLVLLPVLFSSQSIVVQKLVFMDPTSQLTSYLDSTTINNASLLKLIHTTSFSPSASQIFSQSHLVPVDEDDEEEDESIPLRQSGDVSLCQSDNQPELSLPQPDNHGDVSLCQPETVSPISDESSTQLLNSIPDESSTQLLNSNPDETPLLSPIPDEISLLEEKEEQSPFAVPNPMGIHYQVLVINLVILNAIAEAINSEELKQYLLNIQNYRNSYHWNEIESTGDCDGKQTFYQKEAIVQFIIRSPLILSSPVPHDYAERLRQPLHLDENEDNNDTARSHLLHRLNSVSNGSEMSFRNSVKDSDSETGDCVIQHELSGMSTLMGSKYLEENPKCDFDEMMRRVKLIREGKEMKFYEPIQNGAKKEIEETSQYMIPGAKNQTVTLMM